MILNIKFYLFNLSKALICFTVFIPFLTGCQFIGQGIAAQHKPSYHLEPRDQRIQKSFNDTLFSIHTDYKKFHASFVEFDEETFKNGLEILKTPEAEMMRTFLKDFDTIKIIAAEKSFIFCGYSEKFEVSACYDTACNGTEYYHKDAKSNLEQWYPNFPIKNCRRR